MSASQPVPRARKGETPGQAQKPKRMGGMRGEAECAPPLRGCAEAPRFFAHASRAAWTRALCAAVQEELLKAHAGAGQAAFVAAGGATPAPVYEQLAAQPRAFRNVTVLPSDERCAPAGSPLRNDALLARYFGKSGATLLALCDPNGEPGVSNGNETPRARARAADPAHGASDANAFSARAESGAFDVSKLAACEERIARVRPFDVALLGMGADGHTLSWFPGARGLPAALAPGKAPRDADAARAKALRGEARTGAAPGETARAQHGETLRAQPLLVEIFAGASAVAAPCPHRVTLSCAALAGTRRVLLAITGAEKRRVIERALAPDAAATPEALPVRALLEARLPLEIHWTP